MKIDQLIVSSPSHSWLNYTKEIGFFASPKPIKNRRKNRKTLARFYEACVQQAGSNVAARCSFRAALRRPKRKTLPGVIHEDGFLRYHTLGLPLRLTSVKRIWEGLHRGEESDLYPIEIYWNEKHSQFSNVVGAPPGILSKFVRSIRLSCDKALLAKIQSDLALVAEIKDNNFRKRLTLAILSFAAAYRELEGEKLDLPSFTEPGLITYECKQHLIDAGVKTISLIPPKDEPSAVGIYLCQGTELWPSQRAALGSIVANFALHGSATDAYAHSWRRIHKHLKDLTEEGARELPMIAGHSMGGSLAIQMGLYAHDLLQEVHAFNPPMPNERDYSFYKALSKKLQKKILIHVNLDDFAFWRIGAKVIGQVTVYFGKKRWRYFPISLLDALLILPAIAKLYLNLRHAFPAHQHIFDFDEHSLQVKLTQEEIELENRERPTRFDYLRFFPKLYDPMRVFLKMVRHILGWSLEEEYLRNELEIVMLHEQDLTSSTNENARQNKKELEELARQKEQILKKLSQIKR